MVLGIGVTVYLRATEKRHREALEESRDDLEKGIRNAERGLMDRIDLIKDDLEKAMVWNREGMLKTRAAMDATVSVAESQAEESKAYIELKLAEMKLESHQLEGYVRASIHIVQGQVALNAENHMSALHHFGRACNYLMASKDKNRSETLISGLRFLQITIPLVPDQSWNQYTISGLTEICNEAEQAFIEGDGEHKQGLGIVEELRNRLQCICDESDLEMPAEAVIGAPDDIAPTAQGATDSDAQQNETEGNSPSDDDE